MPDLPERGRLSSWKRWTVYAAVWTAVGLFYAAQIRLEFTYADQSIGWPAAIGRGLIASYTWAVLFPLLARLARRFPFDRRSWPISLAIHLPVTLILTPIKVVVDHALAVAAGLPTREADLAVMQLTLMTCWLLVGIGHALAYQRRARERERRALVLEARLAHAQLQLLRNQLQPHFLFNTLHSIGTLMHRDVAAAEGMLTDLSDLLRLALESSDQQELTLQRELELTRLYLGIQQRRFADRLQTEFDIDPDARDALVPSMMLQPIVENAIQHGVSQRQTVGRVSVRARRDGPALRIEVEDDGPAPDIDAPEEPGDWTEGVGLGNTRARLRQLYGDDQLLELTRSERGGVRVAVVLPFRLARGEG